MCAYAATGDVLIIQDLLHVVGEKYEEAESRKPKPKPKPLSSRDPADDNDSKLTWDYSVLQEIAALGAAVVSLGDEIGMEMIQRTLGHVSRYGDASMT